MGMKAGSGGKFGSETQKTSKSIKDETFHFDPFAFMDIKFPAYAILFWKRSLMLTSNFNCKATYTKYFDMCYY